MKINLILLGAGFSRRFDGNKLLMNFCGIPLYMHVVCEVMKIYERNQSTFNKIIFVTQYEEIKENLKGTAIKVIMNEYSSLGISSSIKAGISYDDTADGYMFMVCDQPFIKKESLLSVVNAFVSENKGIAAASLKAINMDREIGDKCAADLSGNPVIFSRKYINELLSLEGDTGGKKVLKNHMDDLVRVYIDDPLEFKDIDTRSAYSQYENYYNYITNMNIEDS